jgi:hypothetical protein
VRRHGPAGDERQLEREAGGWLASCMAPGRERRVERERAVGELLGAPAGTPGQAGVAVGRAARARAAALSASGSDGSAGSSGG